MSGNTVWLASYPKSGNTWFRSIFAAWQHEDPFALSAADPIASYRAQFDLALGVSSSDLTAGEVLRLRPWADEVHDAEFDEPHLRKIHDALFSGADGGPVVSVEATRCAVYVLRDPRDVAVSFAHHSDCAVEVMARRICSTAAATTITDQDIAAQTDQHLGQWSEHVTGWVDRAPFPVHVLRYEDCLADPVASFGAALAFAGFSIRTDELAAAVEQASFARLQERERVEGFSERWARRSPFFRRGIAGGWSDELDVESAALIESTQREVMRRFGYLDEARRDSPTVTVSSRADSAASP